MDPCLKADVITASFDKSPIEYTLGTDPIASNLPFQFEFTAKKSRCSFTVTYALEGVPTMVSLDEANKQFNVAKSF